MRIGGAKENGKAAITAGPQAQLGGYRFKAKDGRPDLAIEVADTGGENVPEDKFTLLVKENGKVVETHNVSTKRGKENVVTVVREQSQLIVIEEVGTLTKPDKGTVALREAPKPPPVPNRVVATDYVGDVADRTGFGGLEAIDDRHPR